MPRIDHESWSAADGFKCLWRSDDAEVVDTVRQPADNELDVRRRSVVADAELPASYAVAELPAGLAVFEHGPGFDRVL